MNKYLRELARAAEQYTAEDNADSAVGVLVAAPVWFAAGCPSSDTPEREGADSNG